MLDFHSCELFPSVWIDHVFVLRTNHTILWDRLLERKYSLEKIQENNQSEIMQVVVDEALESFDKSIVHVLKSDNEEDQAANLSSIIELVNKS